MKIHEYQARQLLAEAGVPVPPSEVIDSPQQAEQAYGKIGGRVVVKAQVFAGGRGKAGFVKLCDNLDQVREAATFMLGHRMVSKQTGPEGIVVKKLLIARQKEYVQLQKLSVLENRVIPASEVDDPLIEDPAQHPRDSQ